MRVPQVPGPETSTSTEAAGGKDRPSQSTSADSQGHSIKVQKNHAYSSAHHQQFHSKFAFNCCAQACNSDVCSSLADQPPRGLQR